jgi:hypothetical protein
MNGYYDTGRIAQVGDVTDVATRADAVRLIADMLADLEANPTAWENHDLASFLEALAVSLNALPGLYANRGEEFPASPTWKMFTEALIMASGYE